MTAGTVLRLHQKKKADGSPENEAEAVGRSIADPAISSGLVAMSYIPHTGVGADLMANIEEVRRITNAVKAGDLGDLEAMLVGQAVALQTMAVSLAERAQRQQAQRNLEAFLGLALKCQAQSRATIDSLVNLKFPRQVMYAKQANINNGGQQQVNNGVVPIGSDRTARAPDAQNESTQTKILEKSDGEWLDTRAQGPSSGADQVLEAVGEGHRAEDGRGKGKGGAKRLPRRTMA